LVKAALDVRLKLVLLYAEKVKTAGELRLLYGIPERTLRRWKRAYDEEGAAGLAPRKPVAKRCRHRLRTALEDRIVRLKQKHPSWGGRRIKHQYNLPVHWTTVHRVVKKRGLLVRIKAKPQPYKRFKRRHVDSLWQGDTTQFRIHDVGKVFVTGFTDDCSRFRVRSKAYVGISAVESVNALQWALKRGRTPRAIYLDNGKQFISHEFKEEAEKHHIKLIYGKPHNPRARGKVERYHSTLYQELIHAVRFKSLAHFRKLLREFDRKYNYWRKHEALGWQTPAGVYRNAKYFNKKKHNRKSGHKVR